MRLGWYVRRLSHMSPGELAWRVHEAALKWRWARLQVRPGQTDPLALPAIRAAAPRPLPASLPVDPAGRARLIAAADAVLAGQWPVFALTRTDFAAPDWFFDPVTGIRAPDDIFAFRYPHRDPLQVGNIKYLWEPSRHHHLTLLATAYYLTGEARYAERVARDLQDWWRRNPFLSGPHWISGIELGVRLISWVWCRRLLNDWPGAAALFENNREFQVQLYRHQQWLHAFPSRYTSANNHVIAEVAGQFVAACAFPIFPQSAKWRDAAGAVLAREMELQTYPCGLNRELATDYHGFVLELCLAAALEGDAAGYPLPARSWTILRDMTDTLAAMADVTGHPPRQGDADDGIGLLLDKPHYDHWAALLHSGAVLFGEREDWPVLAREDIRTPLWTALAAAHRSSEGRSGKLAALADQGGMVLLKGGSGRDEIWCRCDSGPLGFLSTAAHGHADALSVEVRIGGVDVLADPGTYCYHTEPSWRRFFRSTLGHNTLELFGRDQSAQTGTFLWAGRPGSRTLSREGLTGSGGASWRAEHDGYAPVIHRRSVTLRRAAQRIEIRDSIGGGGAPARLAFHLGPAVTCVLNANTALLSWQDGGATRQASLALPAALCWDMARGNQAPIAGWYSRGFGHKVPAFQLTGKGQLTDGQELTTILTLLP